MCQHQSPVLTAKSVTNTLGGPGRCFSCGHPNACGRCAWCCIAADVLHSAAIARTDRVMVSGGTTRERER
jgi:hypothetical protein